jgi:hypothetical protein
LSLSREHTIRLASSQAPGSPLRKQFLASLKQAGGDWQLLMENAKVRVQWKDHPDNQFLVQELPTKPVKRKLRRRQYDTQTFVRWFHPGDAFLMTNIIQDTKLTQNMDYDDVIRAFERALIEAKDSLIENSKILAEKYQDSHPGMYSEYSEADFKKLRFPESLGGYEREVFFLEVEPSDYKPVVFRGVDFGGTSEWGRFTFYNDKDKDEFMEQVEGMRTFYDSKSSGGARNLFKLLKADPEIVKNMTCSKFKEWLDKSDIGYKYNPTVWR